MRFSGRKEELLLAYLALAPETAFPRATVAGELWPTKDTVTARHFLSYSLHALLTQLKSVGATDVIDVGGRKTLQLGQTVKTDVQEYLGFLAGARHAVSLASQGELLEKALMVYRDGLLPGYRAPWIKSARIRLEQVHKKTLEMLPEALKPEGDFLSLLASVAPRTEIAAFPAVWPAGSQDGPELPPATSPVVSPDSLPLLPGDRERLLAFVKEMEPQLAGPDRATWLPKIDAEYDQLLALIEDATERNAYTDALLLASPLWQYWIARGKVDDGLRILESLLEATPTNQDSARAKALHAAGSLAIHTRDLDHAKDYLETALTIWWKLEDDDNLFKTLSNLAVVSNRSGNLQRAREIYAQTLSIARKRGDRWGLMARLLNAALNELTLGEPAQARKLLLERLRIAEEDKNESAIALSLANLATVDLSDDDLDLAQNRASHALATFRALADHRNESFALRLLGRVAHNKGRYEEATDLYRQSLEAAHRSGDWRQIGEALRYLATSAEAVGDIDRAKLLNHQASAMLEASGDLESARKAQAILQSLEEIGAEQTATDAPPAQPATSGVNET